MTQSSEPPKPKTNWYFLIAVFTVLISLYLLGSWVQYTIEKQRYDQAMIKVRTQNAEKDDELGKKLDDYAIPIIKAIQRYKDEKGKYPENLDVLVPEYLIDKPYNPFGDKIWYSVDDHESSFYFAFQADNPNLFALDGWNYIYCPLSDCKIEGGHRLNENWISIHGSPL